MELEGQGSPVNPVNPLAKAELESRRFVADPTRRVEPREEETRDWREPVEADRRTDWLWQRRREGEAGWVYHQRRCRL